MELPILLIEDEETVIRTFKSMLESAGIKNIRTCSNREETLKAVTEDEFAAISLDLLMSGVSGLELLDRVNQEAPCLSRFTLV